MKHIIEEIIENQIGRSVTPEKAEIITKDMMLRDLIKKIGMDNLEPIFTFSKRNIELEGREDNTILTLTYREVDFKEDITLKGTHEFELEQLLKTNRQLMKTNRRLEEEHNIELIKLDGIMQAKDNTIQKYKITQDLFSVEIDKQVKENRIYRYVTILTYLLIIGFIILMLNK